MTASTATNLHNLIRKGSLNEVENFVEQLPIEQRLSILNSATDVGWNAVRVSVAFDRAQILEFLLKCGAHDAPPREKDDWTSLHIAAFHGYSDCLDVLLDAGFKPVSAEKDDDGRWPIHCAVQRDHDECLEHLLRHRCDQNVLTSNTGNTAIHVAAKYGAAKCMSRLLQTQRARAALRQKNKLQRSVMMECVLSDAVGAASCLEMLLTHLMSTQPNEAAPTSPTTGGSLESLKEAFLNCISLSKLPACDVFLQRRFFCDILGQPCITITKSELVGGGTTIAGTSDAASYVITPLQRVFLSWNVAFIRGFLVSALKSGGASDVTRRRESLRRFLLDTPLQTTGLELAVAPLGLLFSTLNKNPSASFSTLCAGLSFSEEHAATGIVAEIVDLKRDLFVSAEIPWSDELLIETREIFLRVGSSHSPDTCTHITRILLSLASKDFWEAPHKQEAVQRSRWSARQLASFWFSMSVAALDCDVLLPEFSIFDPKGLNQQLWTTVASQESEVRNCSGAAEKCGLFRSFIEAKHRQLVAFTLKCRTTD